MEKSFWAARWEKREIGFHAPTVNPQLAEAFEVLFPNAAPRHALVPLCGKSLDLHWLRERAIQITGVEFVPSAVAEFFSEWGVTPDEDKTPAGTRYTRDNVAIVCGDFFAVTPESTAEVDFYYDRAALIALPPELRQPYADQVARLMPGGAQGVIVTIDYDQSARNGPPFAVTDAHLGELFGGAFELARRDRRPVADAPRGLEDAAFTSTWVCRRR